MSARLPPPIDSQLEATTVAGRFEIVRLLGDGSFAMVYEAIDHDLGRRVALKLFTSYAHEDLESALREARAMARLNHENVLAVHDIGEHRGVPFLAIEYAEMDLRRWLAAGSRDADTIMHLFCEAGRGLEAAHRAGLVHHDFKPANVLLRSNGTVAVGDFGLARALDTADCEPEPDENQGYALGTLRYIAPERLRGQAGDERSDQFSFCVALWEALAGAHPFTGSDAERRLDSIAAGPTAPLRGPAHVVRALRRGLSVDPFERFETMGDLLAALTEPVGCGASRWLRHSVRPMLTAAMLAGVFALGVGLSREAPALDVSITPPAVLTADAAMDQARDAAFDRKYGETIKLVMSAMPVIRETDAKHQRDYLAQIEVLGDLLSEAGAFPQAGMIYAAGINLSTDLGLDPKPFVAKRSNVQAEAIKMRAVTRDK